MSGRSAAPTATEFIDALEQPNEEVVNLMLLPIKSDVIYLAYLLDSLTSREHHFRHTDEFIQRGTTILLKGLLGKNPKGLEELFLFCITKNYLSSLKVLIQQGAKVNAVNLYRETPLHEGVRTGNPEIVKLLLDKGADINAKNNDGNTPLHYAHKLNDQRMVNLLIERGARVDIQNKYGFKYADHLIALSRSKNSAFRTAREEELARLEAARALQLAGQDEFTARYTGRGTNYKSPIGIEMKPLGMKGGGSRRTRGKGRAKTSARATKRKQTRKSRSQKSKKNQSQS